MAQPQAKGLGKGLSALMSEAGLPPATPAPANGNDIRSEGLSVVPVEQLVPGTYQPRRHFDEEVLLELAASIEKNGIMQPIIVRAGAPSGQYEIIAGERRWRAAQLAKLKTVPVIIRSVSDAQALELALIENIQRADLNPLEEASGYARLMQEFSYTQEKLASIVGKSRSHVANLLRLLELPQGIKALIDEGKLTMGHARALLGAADPQSLAQVIIAKGLNVRQAEELVKQGSQTKTPSATRQVKPVEKSISEKSHDVLQIEALLSENLGLAVSINTTSAQAGEVVIAYSTLVQLDDILRRLGGGSI